MDHVGPFRVVLLMAGISLASKVCGSRRLCFTINCIIRISIIASSLWFILENMLTCQHFSLTYIAVYSYSIIHLFLMSLCTWRRRRIKLLVNKICSEKPSDSSVKKISTFGLLAAIYAFTVNIVSVSWKAFKTYSDSWSIAVSIAAPIPLYFTAFIIDFTFFYVIVLTMMREREQKTLTDMLKDRKKVTIMICQLDDMMHDRQEFEELFNEIPFMTIAHLFAEVPTAVINITGARVSEGEKFNFAAFLMANVVNVVANAWIVSNVTRLQLQSHVLLTNIRRKLLQEQADRIDSLTDMLALNESLQSHLQFRFTGWGFFSINRSLLLDVLSPLITFSVLICQIFASVS